MQTVAAQWLMLTLTSSAVYVTLVQTAATLPVVLCAVLAGTVGDLFHRRRFLLIMQAGMLLAAAALCLLAVNGLVTPWVLLALVFALGTGQALTSPTWQTPQPELVAPSRRAAEQPREVRLDELVQEPQGRRPPPARRPGHRRPQLRYERDPVGRRHRGHDRQRPVAAGHPEHFRAGRGGFAGQRGGSAGRWP